MKLIRDFNLLDNLSKSFLEGNKNDVIDILSEEHPTIAACFISWYGPHGDYKSLSRDDVEYIIFSLNEKRNKLIDAEMYDY